MESSQPPTETSTTVNSGPVDAVPGSYCSACGSPVDAGAVICPKCGVPRSGHAMQGGAANVGGFVLWGWLSATIGTLLLSMLGSAIAVALGIVVLVKGQGTKTGHGVGIIVVGIVLGILWGFFWMGFAAAFLGA